MTDSLEAAPLHIDEVGTNPTTIRLPILVVDDIAANLVAMEAALEPCKRALVLVSSGEQALAQLLERDFSLILLDVQMPGMNGLETAQLIRARGRSKHTPIIFVTGHAEDATILRRAYDLGAVDFLYKPIDESMLRAKATVFVTLQDQAEELAAVRLRSELEAARFQFESVALHNKAAALAESDRRRHELIATVREELREPLAALRAGVDRIKREPTRAAESIEIVERHAQALARTIEELGSK